MRRLLILAALLISARALGQTVTSVQSGTWADGNSVVFLSNGSDFGTKSTPGPVLWDNMDHGQALGARWDQWEPTACTGVQNIGYRTSADVGRGVAMPHSFVSHYLAGDPCSQSTGSHWNFQLGKNRTVSGLPAYSYMTWYWRLDPNWAFFPAACTAAGTPSGCCTGNGVDGGGCAAGVVCLGAGNPQACCTGPGEDGGQCNVDDFNENHKMYDWSWTHGVWGDPYCYVCYVSGGPTNIASIPNWDSNNDGCGWPSESVQDAGSVPFANWMKVEVAIRHANDSSGFLHIYEDGKLVMASTGSNTATTSGNANDAILSYDRYVSPNGWSYVADAYLDYTLQRVLLCTGSTWGTRGTCEVQNATAWAAGSITVTVNQGKFTNGSTAYLYVTDTQDSLISSKAGYAVTIGGDGWANPEAACAYAGNLFCDGFEGAGSGGYDAGWDDSTTGVTSPIADNGPLNHSGNYVANLDLGTAAGTSDLTNYFTPTQDKVYLRWYQLWETGTDFSQGYHGTAIFGGLASENNAELGRSNYKPGYEGTPDFIPDQVQFGLQTRPSVGDRGKPELYGYYAGMYQDCTDPAGSCWGDRFPCYDGGGAGYCTNSAHNEVGDEPTMVANQWYCFEIMVDLGTPTASETGANGVLDFWVDDQELGPWTGLWFRTSTDLKMSAIWPYIYYDSTHANAGQRIDNVVMSTNRIGCFGDNFTPAATTGSLTGAKITGGTVR